MVFTEELRIIIRSVFESKGFKDAKGALGRISALGKRFGGLTAFGNVKALGEQSRELGRVNSFLKDYGLKAHQGKKFLTELDGKTEASAKSLRSVSEAISTGKLNEFNKGFGKTGAQVQQTTSSFKDFAKESTQAFEAKKYQVFLNQNKKLKQFGFQVKSSGDVVNRFGKQLSSVEKQALINPQAAADFETFNQQLYATPKLLRKTGLGMKNFRQRFQMHLLSVMFFGMQMQRVFMQMGRTTIESFLKITEGTTAAGQGISMLQGAFATLKFVVGEALAESILPFIPAILDLVMKIVNFIETHKKLVAMIVVGGAAFGTMLFMVGQVGLGIQGVSTLFIKLGAAIGLSTGPLLIFFALGIALVAVFIKAWKEFPETVTPLVKGGLAEIKESFKKLIDSVGDLANAITGGEDAWISFAAIAIHSGAAIGEVFDVLIDLATIFMRLVKLTKTAKFGIGQYSDEDIKQADEDMKALKESLSELTKPTKFTEYLQLGPEGIYDKLMKERDRMKKSRIEIKESAVVVGEAAAEGFSTGYEQILTPYGIVFGKQLGNNITQGLKDSNVTSEIESIFSSILSFGEGAKGTKETPELKFDIVPQVDYEAASSAISALEGMKEVTGPLGIDFETIKNVLGKAGEGEGTIPAISALASVTDDAKIETSNLKGNFSNLKEKMSEVGTFITGTFNNQINTSTNVLLLDSRAAMSAAYAQERYNKAKQGGTGGYTGYF